MTAKRRITVFLVVCLVIAAVAAVYYMPQWHPQQQTQASGKGGGRRGGVTNDPVPVLATAAKTADVPVYLDGVGTAKALNTVTVRSQVDGQLINVSFTEGQDVPKGYVLAKIDPVTYQAAYDQTVATKAKDEAVLANARLDLDRYTRLAATNAIKAVSSRLLPPTVSTRFQGSAKVLKSGYVLTIDYGTTWDGILANDSAHFRTYGPVHRAANVSALLDAGGTPPEVSLSSVPRHLSCLRPRTPTSRNSPAQVQEFISRSQPGSTLRVKLPTRLFSAETFPMITPKTPFPLRWRNPAASSMCWAGRNRTLSHSPIRPTSAIPAGTWRESIRPLQEPVLSYIPAASPLS